MTAEQRSMLDGAGYDVDGALARFINNETLYFTFLKKFKGDDNYGKIEGAIADCDYDAIYNAVHALKSVAGNLGIQDVFECTVEMLALIKGRGEQEDIMEQIKAIYVRLKEGYDKAVRIIDAL